jgi:O-antigen/teichoic acid export membrane protein
MSARIKARLPQGRYGKNIAKLAVGTAVGQAVAILASPVLTRLYTPNDFGGLAVYASIIGIIGSLASLSYHQAIPIPEDDSDAANVFGLSLLLILIVVGLTAIATVLVGAEVATLLEVPELSPYLWLVPLGVLGLAGYEAISQWAVRQKEFSAIAQISAAKGVAQTGTHLAFGFLTTGPFGLLLGQFIGQWVGAGSLLRRAVRESGDVFRNVSLSRIWNAATRYSNFLRFTSPSVLLNVAGRNTPPLILAYFFGGAVAGFFALGERVLMIPVTLVAKSASQVFVASAAEFHRQGQLGIEVEHLFARMLKLGLAPVTILGISSPILFAFVFGDQWSEAGHYVRWLSPWLLFVFISFALAPVIFILERQKVGMLFQGVMAIGRIGSLVVGGLVGNALFAVALFGLVSGSLWAIYLSWLLIVSGVSMQRVASICTKEMLSSLIFAAPVAGCIVFSVAEMITVATVFVCTLSAVVWPLVRKSI